MKNPIGDVDRRDARKERLVQESDRARKSLRLYFVDPLLPRLLAVWLPRENQPRHEWAVVQNGLIQVENHGRRKVLELAGLLQRGGPVFVFDCAGERPLSRVIRLADHTGVFYGTFHPHSHGNALLLPSRPALALSP